MVIFDLDGTLADTLPMCISAFRKAVEPFIHRHLEYEEIERQFGLNEEGMIRNIVGEHWEEALEDFYRHYVDMHDLCPTPFDGICELMSELKQSGTKGALVTGNGSHTCSLTLEHWGMKDVFVCIETGSSNKNRKSEAITHILQEYHIDEAVYIGDTVSDVLLSRDAGISCLSAVWSSNVNRDELEKINGGNVMDTIYRLRCRLMDMGYIL